MTISREGKIPDVNSATEKATGILRDELIGTKSNVAKVLVFLARTKKATSRAIELGTDMRQPEVSIAMKYLVERGWIKNCVSSAESKGRPVKVYELAKTITVIINGIEKEKQNEKNNTLALVRKLQDYIH